MEIDLGIVRAKIHLLRVQPAIEKIQVRTRKTMNPSAMRSLCGSTNIKPIRLGDFQGFPVCLVRRILTLEEERRSPRWQLFDFPVIEGEGILFGLNTKMKAASCPLSAYEAQQNIEWLPPLSELGGALTE